MLSIHGEAFDLDLALTMPDDDSSISNRGADEESEAAACHLLDEMPTVVMDEGGECAVCVEGGTAKRIPCGHVFHQHCISRWLSINNSCPLCRAPNLFSNSS